ncbi:GlsB/YeaQ/YmgE family stress response membrane protein, partial [Bacillus atrophaeus]
AGLIGAWIGHGLLGTWGPSLAGFAIIPAVIGAAIVVFLVSLLARRRG